MSSYCIIVPDSSLLINMNAQKLDNDQAIHVDQVLVITRLPTSPKIEEYDERIHSKLLDDWHDYETISIEFTTHDDKLSTVRLLDGSCNFGDLETAMEIARFVIMMCESNRGSGDWVGEEEEMCVICLKEFEEGEMCHTLECRHWYHKECIDEWLRNQNSCPICREMVYSLHEV